jgi:hypothetical protein
MCAWKKTEDETGGNYQEAAKKEAVRMRDDICRYVTIL